jgi:hypothetical protein
MDTVEQSWMPRENQTVQSAYYTKFCTSRPKLVNTLQVTKLIPIQQKHFSFSVMVRWAGTVV